MKVVVTIERWPLRDPFVIARETMHDLPLVHLAIAARGTIATAEAAGVDYRGETPETMADAIQGYLGCWNSVPSREAVRADMPAGGARNAVDCALWAWEARHAGGTVRSLIGLPPRASLTTVFTLGLASPTEMAAKVADAPAGSPLKLKLGGGDGKDIERVAAVRAVAAKRMLLVDVNEGWSTEQLLAYLPTLLLLDVRLIEQPLARGRDAALASLSSPIPIFADESFDDLHDLDRLHGYAGINIKLDKCGGLTTALAIVEAARARGLQTMVGSMLGTSLGMAPAYIVGERCDYVDLDGPLLLARDRQPGLRYDGGVVFAPGPEIWG